MKRVLLILVLTALMLLWAVAMNAISYRLTRIQDVTYVDHLETIITNDTIIHYNLNHPSIIDSVVIVYYDISEYLWKHYSSPCFNQTFTGSMGGVVHSYEFINEIDQTIHWEVERDASGRVIRTLRTNSSSTYNIQEMTRYFWYPDDNKPDCVKFLIGASEFYFFFDYDDLGRISEALVHKYSWGHFSDMSSYHITYGELLPMELKLEYGCWNETNGDHQIIYSFLIDPRYEILSIDNLHYSSISSGWYQDVWGIGIGISDYMFYQGWSAGFNAEGLLIRNTSSYLNEGYGSSSTVNYEWEPAPVANSDEHQSVAIPNLQLYPNPSRETFTIALTSPLRELANLSIFNSRGQLIRKMLVPANSKTCTWDGVTESGVAASSGLYLFRLETSNTISTAKAVLLRD